MEVAIWQGNHCPLNAVGLVASLVCTTTAAYLAGLLCCPKLNAISWPFSPGLLEMPSLFDSSNAPRKNKICLSVEDLLGSVLVQEKKRGSVCCRNGVGLDSVVVTLVTGDISCAVKFMVQSPCNPAKKSFKKF